MKCAELHSDTPYYDASRKHISKYTLIIYLSDGEGAPALKIESDKSAAHAVTLRQLRRFQVRFMPQLCG